MNVGWNVLTIYKFQLDTMNLSNTLPGMWLLFHIGIKDKPC